MLYQCTLGIITMSGFTVILYVVQGLGKSGTLTPQEESSAFVNFWMLNFLLMQAEVAFCELCGCLCSSLESALAGAGLGVIVQVVFSGVMAQYQVIRLGVLAVNPSSVISLVHP